MSKCGEEIEISEALRGQIKAGERQQIGGTDQEKDKGGIRS